MDRVVALGRQCKVCYSLHRKEYEELRLKKHLKLSEIQEYAWNKYREKLSIGTLSRHFRFHVEELLQAQLEASKLRTSVLREEIHKDIKVARALRENLEILNEQLMRVSEMDSPEQRNEARQIISKINDTIELLLKFSDKIKLEESVSEDEIYERVVYALEPLPNEYVMEFKKRWDEYPKVKGSKNEQ